MNAPASRSAISKSVDAPRSPAAVRISGITAASCASARAWSLTSTSEILGSLSLDVLFTVTNSVCNQLRSSEIEKT
ncbi:hypothetical protein EBR21_06645 [bacterium]|nr:hypothetical protein [bacterium]